MNQPDLARDLAEHPRAFGFFQAVRLLERLASDRSRIGTFGDPTTETVRFGVNPTLAFPANEIEDLDVRSDAPPRLTVNFMGLIGPLGVLPHHYTAFVAERRAARDHAGQAFLDIFHHRMVSLFYRAWKKNHFEVAYEEDRRDPVTEHLFDLLGLGLQSQRHTLGIADEALIRYAALLAPHPRSAVGLEQLIMDHFGMRAEVQQFIGGWYALTEGGLTRLGTDTPATRLGAGAVMGGEVWDSQGRIRIRLGPLTRRQHADLLPGAPGYRSLLKLARFFSDDQFDIEVQLVLARDEAPPCILGADVADATPLGWSTWLRSAPLTRDPDDTLLTLTREAAT